MNKRLLRTVQWFGRACGFEVMPASTIGINPVRDAVAIAGRDSFRHVLDVGANEGQTAVQFARAFQEATVYSFEPFPSGFEKLSEKARTFPNIKPFQLALGEQPGRQTLYLTSSTFTHSLLPTAPEARNYLGKRVNPAGKIDVPVTTLDSFCTEHSIRHIDLLKLDVQGYELRILAGAKGLLDGRRVSLIFTEVNFVPLYENQAYFHEVYDFLLERDFQLVSFYNQTHREGPGLNWADALFVSKQRMSSPN